MTEKNLKPETRLVQGGRDHDSPRRLVNPPVSRGSTVLFSTLAELRQASERPYDGLYYGRFGTDTHTALHTAWSELTGAAGTVSTVSGLAAITVSLLSIAREGKALLVADNVYEPTRKLCDGLLARLGLRVCYFDPRNARQLEALIDEEQAGAVFIESPGSLTFELTDIPAVVELARPRKLPVILDNTWATALYLDDLAMGVNISINAATKYVVGHADVMAGLIACDATWWPVVRSTATAMGQYLPAEDAWLTLRGLRTMAVRMAQHQLQAQRLCEWLSQQPEVIEILWPAWPAHPDHALWKRDFRGAGGLFSVLLKPVPDAALAAMLDGLQLFGIGYSWGGFESLVLPADPSACRSAVPWARDGRLLRIHAGLENVDDLIADLQAAFRRLRQAAAG